MTTDKQLTKVIKAASMSAYILKQIVSLGRPLSFVAAPLIELAQMLLVVANGEEGVPVVYNMFGWRV